MVACPKADLILFENEKHRLEAYTQLRKTTKALALRSCDYPRIFRWSYQCHGG